MSLYKQQMSVEEEVNEFLNNDPTFQIKRGFVEDSWMYGSFRTLAKPSMLTYNGATYSLWYKEKAHNNQVGIFKQKGDLFQSSIVNQGTIESEPINHPGPMSHISKATGHIYVLQNTLHVNTIRVWKSEFPEDISSFNYVGEFGTPNCSYLGHLEGDDSDIVLQTRAGVVGLDDFSMSIIKVNLDTLVHTQTQLTFVNEPNTNSRHYLVVPFQYGTSTKTCFGIAHRNGDNTGYWKISALTTEKGGDWEVFENISGTFSKNVITEGVITNTELEDHYAVVGSDNARSTIVGEGKMINLNDDAFVVYKSDDANSRFSVRKSTYGSTVVSDFLIPVETIAESPIWYGPVYMRYNGNNFVFTIAEHDGFGGYVTKIYGCDLNFNNWTEFDVDTMANGVVPEVTGYFYGMPENLHEAVASGEKYMMVGKDLDSKPGEFIYAITDRTWNI